MLQISGGMYPRTAIRRIIASNVTNHISQENVKRPTKTPQTHTVLRVDTQEIGEIALLKKYALGKKHNNCSNRKFIYTNDMGINTSFIAKDISSVNANNMYLDGSD